MKFWSPRKLLIAKALTLDGSLTEDSTTANSFIFSSHYPLTSQYDYSEEYRVLRTLLGLQSAGLIELSDFRLSKEYTQFYDNLKAETDDDFLSRWAQSEKYGLRPQTLWEFEHDEPLNRRHLVLMLISKNEVKYIDDEGEGPTVLDRENHPALAYPLYVARYLSFQVTIPEPRNLREAIDTYVRAFMEGLLQEITLYFGYHGAQKAVMLDTIKSIHDKQTSRRITLRLGSVKAKDKPENPKDMDEYTRVLRNRHKKSYEASNLRDVNSPQSYHLKPLETLLGLEIEGLLTIKKLVPHHIPTIDRSSTIYPKGHVLTDFVLELNDSLFKALESGEAKSVSAPKEKPDEAPEERALRFYEKDGTALYRDKPYRFARDSKAHALLKMLDSSKNTPFKLSEIAEHCNGQIVRKDRKFKTEKDLRDTIAYIREQLGVNKGEYFPIQKEGKNVSWVER